jgi:quercetin dioxygenase-like cupin family protein
MTLALHTLDPAISRGADRRTYLWAGGTTWDVVLGGEQTGGGIALLDQVGARGDVTPLHLHRDEAEVFYVLDGSIAAWTGDVRHEASAGDALWLPPGQAHALGVTSETARILTLTVAATFADFVRAAGVPVDRDVPTAWEFDLGRIMAAAEPHGIEILGPPPAL